MLNVDYVQEIMDDHGWTLGQLSSKSGLSKAQFSCLFRDKRHAGAKTMEGILRAFPEADRDCYFFTKIVTNQQHTRDKPNGNCKRKRTAHNRSTWQKRNYESFLLITYSLAQLSEKGKKYFCG